jgi:hypothetical protein
LPLVGRSLPWSRALGSSTRRCWNQPVWYDHTPPYGAAHANREHPHPRVARPVEQLGKILDTLAGPDDKIWPIERWSNAPIGFDRPLAVGAGGGHGGIPYTIVAYEPGRRIAFEFEPGSGLRGHHRFEVEPAGSDRAACATCSTSRPSRRVTCSM